MLSIHRLVACALLLVTLAAPAPPSLARSTMQESTRSSIGPTPDVALTLPEPTPSAFAPLIDVGDTNGDGRSDYLVSLYTNALEPRVVYFYSGAALVSGAPPTTIIGGGAGMPPAFGGEIVALGDANGDGRDDFAITGELNSNAQRIFIFYGRVDNTYNLAVAPQLLEPGDTAQSYGESLRGGGDVNGDGYADLIVAHTVTGGGAVYVYYGGMSGLTADPSLTLRRPASIFGGIYGQQIAILGDINSDGFDDVGVSLGRSLFVYAGGQSGLNPVPLVTIALQQDLAAIAKGGDVNGDNYTDLLISTENFAIGSQTRRLEIYPGGPGGPSLTPSVSPKGEGLDVYVLDGDGDLNGDGYADVIAGFADASKGTRGLLLFLGSLSGPPEAASLTINTLFPDIVTTGGDFDGDGLNDIALRSQGAILFFRGATEVLSVSTQTILAAPEPTTSYALDLAAAGDVNGDGFADALVGAELARGGKGAAYLYFGGERTASPIARPGSVTVADRTLTGTATNNGYFGTALAGLGDVNGDGYGDLAVGEPGIGTTSKVLVYHGRAGGPLDEPSRTLNSVTPNSSFGSSVAGVGDVNGDGYADLAVGAPQAGTSASGAVYLYQGGPGGLAATPALTLTGAASSSFGGTLAGAGDVNGDGYDDLLVGAQSASSVTLYLGGSDGLVTALPITRSSPAGPFTQFAASLAAAGDVNGDGFADIVVGAPGANNNLGAAYVYLGGASGLSSAPARTYTGSTGFGGVGHAVAGAGDTDGDGYADLAVGSFDYGAQVGAVYLYRGGPGGPASTPALTMPSGAVNDGFGTALAGLGDVNGDGYADLLAGAPHRTNGASIARIYRGNTGQGRHIALTQRDQVSQRLQPTSRSATSSSVVVGARGISVNGAASLRLEVEACPPGAPFGHTSCLRQTGARWTLAGGNSEMAVELTLADLNPGTRYRWRARVQETLVGIAGMGFTRPVAPKVGPWRRLSGQLAIGDVRAGPRDQVAPTVAVGALPNVSTAGASAYDLSITYSDNTAIRASTINTGDIRVSGPGGFSADATLVAVNDPADGTPRTALYRLVPPGGTWDAGDTGSYTVRLQAGEVVDTTGNAIAAGALGTFQVTIGGAPAPSITPASGSSGGPGSLFQLTATGFTPGGDINVDIDGQPVGRLAADQAGGFVIGVFFPPSTPPGIYTVQATERTETVMIAAMRQASLQITIVDGNPVRDPVGSAPVFSVKPQIYLPLLKR